MITTVFPRIPDEANYINEMNIALTFYDTYDLKELVGLEKHLETLSKIKEFTFYRCSEAQKIHIEIRIKKVKELIQLFKYRHN